MMKKMVGLLLRSSPRSRTPPGSVSSTLHFEHDIIGGQVGLLKTIERMLLHSGDGRPAFLENVEDNEFHDSYAWLPNEAPGG